MLSDIPTSRGMDWNGRSRGSHVVALLHVGKQTPALWRGETWQRALNSPLDIHLRLTPFPSQHPLVSVIFIYLTQTIHSSHDGHS